MTRVQRPDTAFTLSAGRRRPRDESSKHLIWIRTLPSVVSGGLPVEAAHIRFGSMAHGKRETGVGEKPDDCWTVPLLAAEHRAQHAHGDERAWWASIGHTSPLDIALRLWAASGDDERGKAIVRAAVQEALDRRTMRSHR